MIDNDTPSLACSPDGLVDIPEEEYSVVEFKCPYTAAKEGLDLFSAAKTLETFFCKASVEENRELKRRHDYFYQVQVAMAIMGRSWCNFVVWSPKGMPVEWIKFDQISGPKQSQTSSISTRKLFCQSSHFLDYRVDSQLET